VPSVLLVIKPTEAPDVLLAVLVITHQQMELFASIVQLENTLMQHPALVQVAAVDVTLAHQPPLVLFAVLALAIYLERALNVALELIQLVEQTPVNLVEQAHTLLQELAVVNLVVLDVQLVPV